METHLQLPCNSLYSLGIQRLTRYPLRRLCQARYAKAQLFLLFLLPSHLKWVYRLGHMYLGIGLLPIRLNWFCLTSFFQSTNSGESELQAWRIFSSSWFLAEERCQRFLLIYTQCFFFHLLNLSQPIDSFQKHKKVDSRADCQDSLSRKTGRKLNWQPPWVLLWACQLCWWSQ